MNLLSAKNKKTEGAWSQIASVLPNRSVQSCHNHCRRKFNPFNYKSIWSEEDEILLVDYVKKYGNEWESIGRMLGRTALNVRDKYKQLGGVNSHLRVRGR